MLNNEMVIKNELDSDKWKYFAELLYPFKTNKFKKTNTISITDLSTKGGPYTIDSIIPLESSLISTTVSENVVTDTNHNILSKIMFPYIKFIQSVNDLTKQYSNKELFEQNVHIWEMYKKTKLD
jgi:hypothetical protein